jgi:Mn-dependent DtxR family transcriptional regulator
MININSNIFDLKVNNSAKLFYVYLQHTKALEKSNAHYADCFEVSTMTITNWLNELQDKGIIEIIFDKNKRKIKINE